MNRNEFRKNTLKSDMSKGNPDLAHLPLNLRMNRTVPDLKYAVNSNQIVAITPSSRILADAQRSIKKVVNMDTSSRFSREGFLKKHAPSIVPKSDIKGSSTLQMASSSCADIFFKDLSNGLEMLSLRSTISTCLPKESNRI